MRTDSGAAQRALTHDMPVTAVTFRDFLAATMIATVPAIMAHCSAGAAAASLLDIGSAPSSWLTTANGVVGAIGGGALVQQLAVADASHGVTHGGDDEHSSG